MFRIKKRVYLDHRILQFGYRTTCYDCKRPCVDELPADPIYNVPLVLCSKCCKASTVTRLANVSKRQLREWVAANNYNPKNPADVIRFLEENNLSELKFRFPGGVL